jgi:putative tryptophan/tyrosine transport system substrate-binding protein
MRRREFITLLGGAAGAWTLGAHAQQSERIRRIGVLIGLAEIDPESQIRIAAIRDELQKKGWTEGRNLRIDFRWGPGDASLVRAFAKELVELQPDVIIGHASPAVSALLKETVTIPIVFAQVSDPVAAGFVQSFARPGGNVTGFTNYEYTSIGGKWLELLKQIAPQISRVGVIFNPDTTPFEAYLRSVGAGAPSFSVEAIPTPARDANDIEREIASFATQPNGGLLVIPDIFTGSHRSTIISAAARHSLPAIYPFRFFAANGGLMAYGIEPVDMYRRAAGYVDRILRGEKPADLPVQSPIKLELIINLKTAKALGLEIPPTLLARADEVIE